MSKANTMASLPGVLVWGMSGLDFLIGFYTDWSLKIIAASVVPIPVLNVLLRCYRKKLDQQFPRSDHYAIKCSGLFLINSPKLLTFTPFWLLIFPRTYLCNHKTKKLNGYCCMKHVHYIVALHLVDNECLALEDLDGKIRGDHMRNKSQELCHQSVFSEVICRCVILLYYIL